MNYTAVIRTLGTAGEKYQILLDSLNRQTVQPSKILVYIAEGYAIPKETIGKEQYIYVKKGMVAQRALLYHEVDTEFILFLDDDLFLPDNFVEKMYSFFEKNRHKAQRKAKFYLKTSRSASWMQSGEKQISA